MDHVVLPIIYLPVAFYFLLLVVAVVYVQSSVMGKVPESHLIEAFKEHVVC